MSESGFTINGNVYPEVTLVELDTDERFILYEYAKLRAEDFLPEPGEAEADTLARIVDLTKHPGFWPALWHCAYRRRHPDDKFDAVRAIIGKCRFPEVMATLGPAESEEDDLPLALTSEPQPLSANGSLDNASSTEPTTPTPGPGSTTGLGSPVSVPPPTGVSRSDTSSILARKSSAA